MPYRLKINGLQFQEEIEGAQDWTRSIVRDFNDRVFRTRGDYRFKGHKGLYNLLYNHLAVNGVCEALTGRIYFNGGSEWDFEWEGEILPQDGEFDLLKRSVDTQVLDSSWASKFNNTQDQKVFLRSTTSKNGVNIGQCDYNSCQFFDPTDSVEANYLPDRRICFRIWDVFTFLVKYYSDDTVTFQSDFFDIGGDGDQYYITTGQEIREATGWLNPEVSFSEVFDEMNKKCNLWIVIEGSVSNPILRIEPWSYVFENSKILELRDPENLKMTTDLDQLYTTISVGSAATAFDTANDADYPDIRFYAWNDESYNTVGDCQFENNELNLVSSWTIDSNSIQQALAGDDGFDSNIFLIEIDPTAPGYNAFKFTTEFTSSTTADYIYNYNLTNEQVILNWFNGIPQEIQKELNANIYARVSGTAITSYGCGTNNQIVIFTDDTTAPNSDVDGIYTTPTESGGYLIPPAGAFQPNVEGWYNFFLSFSVNNATGNQVFMRVEVFEDTTRAVTLALYELGNWAPNGVPYTFQGNANVFIPAGAVAYVVFLKQCGGSNILEVSTSTYCIVNSVDIGYSTPPPDPLVYLYTADRAKLSDSDFDLIDQGLGFVRIIDTVGERYYDVYCKDVKYNREKGVIEAGEFIGGRPPTDLCWVLETGFWDDDCYYLDSKYWPD